MGKVCAVTIQRDVKFPRMSRPNFRAEFTKHAIDVAHSNVRIYWVREKLVKDFPVAVVHPI